MQKNALLITKPSVAMLKSKTAIRVQKFTKAYDRFLIIDDKEVYHIGASLKDLGKKWFTFSKFDIKAIDLLKK